MEILRFAVLVFILIWFGWNISALITVRVKNRIPAKSRRIAARRRKRVIVAWANIAAMLFMIIVTVVMVKVAGPRINDTYYVDEGEGTSTLTVGTGDTLIEAGSVGKEGIEPYIEAGYAYVYNADSGECLYGKQEDAQIAPASTTKLLTVLTVLKYCSTDELATVGDELGYVTADASRAWLEEGDIISIHDLMVATLLPSGNDAAYTLAVYTGRKICSRNGVEYASTQEAVNAFVGEMNKLALEAGAENSSFQTPDGYDAPGQYTTAEDLCKITQRCMENSEIMDIVGCYKIDSTWENGKYMSYVNSNRLLEEGGAYYYPGVLGMKTGTSDNAGACIISVVEINGNTYICVIMDGSDEGRWEDTLAVYSELERLQ